MYDRLIRFAARHDPHAIAAIGAGGHVTFAELDRAIDRTAAELARTFPPAWEGVVGIAIADTYLHLVVVLACARIGVASASLLTGMAAATAALAGAEKIIADDPALAPVILANLEWFNRTLAVEAVPPAVAIDPEANGRVHFSSGTTGMPKACALSWSLMERRIGHTWNFASGVERTLSLVGPESGALQVFLNCWARNGCVLFGERDPQILARQLPVLRPSGILATPVQIGALLDAWPEQAPPLSNCWIFLAGSRAEAALRDRVSQRLGARISVAYGSTEAGLAAVGIATRTAAPGFAGIVTPWTEIEVAAPDGRAVPPGETGLIRLRGPDVVRGYIGEPRFADGWFETGDLGSLDAQGQLLIQGRVDDVLNLGGRKIAPETIEELVRSVPGVLDVAAFGVADANGIEQPWLAVVRGEDLDENAVGRALALPELPAVHLAWIDAIPRTRLGKVQREILRAAASRPQQQ